MMHNFWRFNTKEAQYVSSHLYLWAKGICVTAHDEYGNLVSGQAYSYEQVYELRILENLILNEPLLSDPSVVKKIFMSVSRHIIYPQELEISRSDMDEWLLNTHYIEYDEDINTAHIDSLGVDVIYPKKKIIRSILQQYFPERQSKFFIAPKSLLQPEWDAYVFILMLDETCSITIYHNSLFIHHSIIDCQNVEDIIIQTNQILMSLHLELNDFQFRLGGIAKNIDDIKMTFETYFSEDKFQYLSPELTFKAFALCE